MGIVPSNTAQGASLPEQSGIIAKLKNVLSKGNKSKHVHPYAAQRTDVDLKRNHNEDNVAYIIPKDPAILAKKGALYEFVGVGGLIPSVLAPKRLTMQTTTATTVHPYTPPPSSAFYH